MPADPVEGPFRLGMIEYDGTIDMAHVFHDPIHDLGEAFAGAQSLANHTGKSVVVEHRDESDPEPPGFDRWDIGRQITWGNRRDERLADRVWTRMGQRSPA